jgi:SWI/SNF-related matrix-associated actin-dependent regulator of chromatin subfamily A3
MLSNLTIKRNSKLLDPSVSSTPVTIVTVRERELRLLSDPDVLVGTFDPSTAKALSTLKAQEGIQLQSYITQQSETQRRLPKDFPYTLSVVIYGPKRYSESVGEFLLQCNLHLQDPRHCDRNVVYSNPQSLVQDTRMTQEQDLEVFQEVHNLPCSVDLLADLETEDYWADAKTPIALKTELHSHQKQALTFMERRERGWAFTGPGKDIWRATQSSQKTIEYTNIISGEVTDAQPPNFRGGLLADQMGLGKSLSIIALIARDQEISSETTGIRLNDHTANTTLLVVRAALLQTWEHQLRTHVHPGKLTWRLHHEKSRFKDRTQLHSTDVIITTYHTLMSEWKKHQASPQMMYTTTWRRVVLDEAHDIRDHRSMIAKAMCDIEASSRWALTGTPVQNRISDLASLFRFLRVYPYHDTTVFADQVATLSRDAEQGIDKLKDMIRCIMLRRSIVRVNLPGRRDIVSKLLFSPQELDAYNRVKYRTLEALRGESDPSLANGTQFSILSWMQKLLMICSLGAKANISEPCNTGKALSVRGAWDTTTAQQAFNRLVTVGEAICSSCATDLVSVVTEAADPTPGMMLHPALFSCLHLVCGPCQERSRDRLTCRHDAPCSHSIISALSSNTRTEDTSSDKESSSGSTSHDAPTKVKALLQDILAHYDQEKRCVIEQR